MMDGTPKIKLPTIVAAPRYPDQHRESVQRVHDMGVADQGGIKASVRVAIALVAVVRAALVLAIAEWIRGHG